MQRPQQLSLSSMPRQLAIALGQVMPDRPNSWTSDSRIPLHIQTYIFRLSSLHLFR